MTAVRGQERTLVELVGADGGPLGPCGVVDAHTAPGRLHRAFSVFLVDGHGRLLLQRRAEGKSRFAGLWSNTCCSHPAPGEDVAASAAGRLHDELGVSGVRLSEAGRFTYRAADEASRLVEHEYDHVLLGSYDGAGLAPDPAEVAECRWVGRDALRAELAAGSERFTPWLPQALDVAERGVGPG